MSEIRGKLESETEEKIRVQAGAKADVENYSATIANIKEQLKTQIQACAEFESETEEKTKSFEDNIAKLQTEAVSAAEALSKTQEMLKAETEEKIRVQAGAKADVKNYSAVIANTKQQLKAEIEMKGKAQEKLKAEMQLRAKFESETQEKVNSLASEVAKLRAKATEAMAAAESRAKENFQAQHQARIRFEAEVEEKTNFAGKIAAIKSKLKSGARAERIASDKEQSKAQAELRVKLEAQAEEKITSFVEEIARFKTEVANDAKALSKAQEKLKAKTEAHDRLEAETEERVISFVAEIAKLKVQAVKDAETLSQAQEKLKAKTEAHDRLEAETEEKIKSFADKLARFKAESAEAMTKAQAMQGHDTKITLAEITNEAFENTSEEKDACWAIDDELSPNRTSMLLSIQAQDIMQENIVWSSPQDSVQQVFEKMRSHRSEYVIIGYDGIMEGIVSRSDLVGTSSSYLRPLMSKWQESQHNATVNIEIKWVMTRNVHTISPDTSYAAIIEKMRLFCGRALPVVDQGSKVLGLVTPFNILKVRALLKLESVCHHQNEIESNV